MFCFSAAGFGHFWLPGSMLFPASCFSAVLPFCFSPSLLLCFSAFSPFAFAAALPSTSRLFCFSAFLLLRFYAFGVACFLLFLRLCFTCSALPASVLFCVPALSPSLLLCFSAFVLLCLSTSTITIIVFLFFSDAFFCLCSFIVVDQIPFAEQKSPEFDELGSAHFRTNHPGGTCHRLIHSVPCQMGSMHGKFWLQSVAYFIRKHPRIAVHQQWLRGFCCGDNVNATADAPPDIKFKVCPQRSGEEATNMCQFSCDVYLERGWIDMESRNNMIRISRKCNIGCRLDFARLGK